MRSAETNWLDAVGVERHARPRPAPGPRRPGAGGRHPRAPPAGSTHPDRRSAPTSGATGRSRRRDEPSRTKRPGRPASWASSRRTPVPLLPSSSSRTVDTGRGRRRRSRRPPTGERSPRPAGRRTAAGGPRRPGAPRTAAPAPARAAATSARWVRLLEDGTAMRPAMPRGASGRTLHRVAHALAASRADCRPPPRRGQGDALAYTGRMSTPPPPADRSAPRAGSPPRLGQAAVRRLRPPLPARAREAAASACSAAATGDALAVPWGYVGRGGRRPDREEAVLPRPPRRPGALLRDARLQLPLLVLPELVLVPGRCATPRPSGRLQPVAARGARGGRGRPRLRRSSPRPTTSP